VQPLLNQAERVPPLHRIRCCGRGSSTRELAERDPRAQATRVPIHNEGRNDGLVAPGRDAEEVDERDLLLGGFAEPHVIGRRWIGAHESIIQLVLAGEDLLVHLALIVVPDPPALPREHGSDA
jgi:hypothetical protein